MHQINRVGIVCCHVSDIQQPKWFGNDYDLYHKLIKILNLKRHTQKHVTVTGFQLATSFDSGQAIHLLCYEFSLSLVCACNKMHVLF